MALTGTPVENRLSELWSIMQFLNPGYLGSRAAFRKRFALPNSRIIIHQPLGGVSGQAADIAAKIMAGMTLKELGFTKEVEHSHYAVKEAIFPFLKFPGTDAAATALVSWSTRSPTRETAVPTACTWPPTRAPSTRSSSTRGTDSPWWRHCPTFTGRETSDACI